MIDLVKIPNTNRISPIRYITLMILNKRELNKSFGLGVEGRCDREKYSLVQIIKGNVLNVMPRMSAVIHPKIIMKP